MRRRGEDEYIDYSCSTPLERLARDVETLLRSWHIIEGSDRHVSFHREKPSPSAAQATQQQPVVTRPGAGQPSTTTLDTGLLQLLLAAAAGG